MDFYDFKATKMNGQVVGRFAPIKKPESLEKEIEKYL